MNFAKALVTLLSGPMILSVPLFGQGSSNSNSRSAVVTSSSFPLCQVEGKNEITIRCGYKGTLHLTQPSIALDHAMLSFNTGEDSHMVVELTFANTGKVRISRNWIVYLAIDDEAGRNYVRRPLPGVDFRKIAPGEELTFPERLLAPSLRPGHYTIVLWIPNPNPALRFDPLHNFFLSNSGVSNPATGLNVLAALRVVP